MWPFDTEINALNGLFEWVAGFVNILSGLLVACLMAICYPLVVFLGILQHLVNLVLIEIIGFINALITLPNVIIELINLLFVGVFPSIWVSLLVLSVLLSVGLRLYSFLKDISIVGCKI